MAILVPNTTDYLLVPDLWLCTGIFTGTKYDTKYVWYQIIGTK